ncbi:MAG TPA: T9SS type A sorting domain-containing protein, partial [bacterium (Candidatus Stahlbacteria)]|nr:T9SS type A sorting domain-containing protein [Candidatus Stahlbacteria bacterium]
NYDWFGPTADPNENGPDAATMGQYPIVIWNCYDYWWGASQGMPPCLTSTDQTEIGNYIGSGGSFWFIGQDAVYSGVPTSWLNTFFYLQSVTEDYAWNAPSLTEQGEAEIAGITCTFTCDYQSNGFFSDDLTPASGAHTVLADQTYPGNNPAILYPGTDYKTTFWTVDGRGPDNWDNWKAMVQGIINTLGVGEQKPTKVSQVNLNISPNPLKTQTRISYQLPKKGHTFLALYDQTGRNLMTLVNRVEEAGAHAISLRTKNLANGVYFIRLENGTVKETKQLIILR